MPATPQCGILKDGAWHYPLPDDTGEISAAVLGTLVEASDLVRCDIGEWLALEALLGD